MARRAVWLFTGVVAGAASSLYAERKLRRTIEVATARLQPESLVTEVGRTARQAALSTGGRVRDAVATGRDEMRRREVEIWAGLATADDDLSPGGPGVPSDRVGGGATEAPSPEATHPSPARRRRVRKSPSHLGK
ncbi:MAG: hypothetical protein ABSF84_09120 [Acidimicrobiales bacterium]